MHVRWRLGLCVITLGFFAGATPGWFRRNLQVQTGPNFRWDMAYEAHLDLATQLTVLYLLGSALVLFVLIIRFLARRRAPINPLADLHLRNWFRLSVLILLVYTVTEFASLLSSISISKMIGISALSGCLANIFFMWTAGLWLLVALSIAHWIVVVRLKCPDSVNQTTAS
jgi:hypothetical protein